VEVVEVLISAGILPGSGPDLLSRPKPLARRDRRDVDRPADAAPPHGEPLHVHRRADEELRQLDAVLERHQLDWNPRAQRLQRGVDSLSGPRARLNFNVQESERRGASGADETRVHGFVAAFHR
jgi:hypothetical protein